MHSVGSVVLPFLRAFGLFLGGVVGDYGVCFVGWVLGVDAGGHPRGCEGESEVMVMVCWVLGKLEMGGMVVGVQAGAAVQSGLSFTCS